MHNQTYEIEEKKNLVARGENRSSAVLNENPYATTPAVDTAVRPHTINGRPSPVGDTLIRLQRSRGNRYVQRLVVQTKMMLGPENDPYEQEADQAAQQVSRGRSQNVQRQVMGEEGTAVSPETESAINRTRGGGRPLPDNIQQQMSQAFHTDFSHVRIHTDSQADWLNQSLGARAFTTGQHIFFSRGEYRPGGQDGQHLLGHELAHVVQQNAYGNHTVIQRTKKQDIMDKGFSDQNAEELKRIIGGWVEAKRLVYEDGLTQSYFTQILANHQSDNIRKKVFLQLSEHNYTVTRNLSYIGGANFESLINKGLNNSTADKMIGYPTPSFRATLLSLHDINELTNLGPLGKIVQDYPAFEAHINAQKGGNPTAVNTVITWLDDCNRATFRYLQANNPPFNVLETMAAQQFTNALTPLLSNFSKEAAPANNAYEQIGAKGKSYRVGHFARFHTLRGIPLNQNLGETKTLWPVATTVADVRTICQEFDQNTDFEAGRYEYYYTPPLNNVPIKVHGNSAIFEPTSFDQMYPRQGVNIAQSQVDKLSAVAALKNDWAG